MKQVDIVLINPNRLLPPIGPIGIDCLQSYLSQKGCSVEILDLNPLKKDEHVELKIKSFFSGIQPVVVGISIRNIDDSSYFSSRFLLSDTKSIFNTVRSCTKAPIVLGGVGFSIMPVSAMSYLKADYGIAGDGEEPLYALISSLKGGKKTASTPGLIIRRGDECIKNDPYFGIIPRMNWRVFPRNTWYLAEGGQVGIETKRGCDGKCIFCADPIAKGSTIRLRDPGEVAKELKSLVEQGITCFHTCDSEFNRPPNHAIAVCKAIIKEGIGDALRLYAYCSPIPFSGELAIKMKQAGFRGINFGVDHVNDSILLSLGRDHTSDHITAATNAAKAAGLHVMHDLLLGSPFETEKTLGEVIEKEKESRADCIGVSIGVRLYPNTALFTMLSIDKVKHPEGKWEENPLAPLFFLAPGEEVIIPLLCDLIGDDRRFFFQPLGEKYNYNYADNTRLLQAIREGGRGAYWDILRKL